jgi:hypothetical protein
VSAATPQRSSGGPRKPLDDTSSRSVPSASTSAPTATAGRMDNCVRAHGPVRQRRGARAVRPRTLACYRDLRASGATPAQAVRGALLGAGAPCGPGWRTVDPRSSIESPAAAAPERKPMVVTLCIIAITCLVSFARVQQPAPAGAPDPVAARGEPARPVRPPGRATA